MSIIKDSDHLRIPLRDIELATNTFNTLIGKGGYGNVYKGNLSLGGQLTDVAVKRLDTKFSNQGLKEFLMEILLLSRYKHPNLVSLFGFCDQGPEKILIYEYAHRGSLERYLRGAQNSTCQLTWRQRLNICIDAARGLDHLHHHVAGHERVIHRDVKSGNILLDSNWKAMIADLGLSKLGRANENETFLITNACGTQGYCDPAYQRTGILTKESDVYSFGVVLFEVLCGRLCFLNVESKQRFLPPLAQSYYKKEKLNRIIDPTLSEYMDSKSMKKFSRIAYQCLLDDRKGRPSMDLVLYELEKALELLDLEEASKKIVIKQVKEVIQGNAQNYFSSGSRVIGDRIMSSTVKIKKIFEQKSERVKSVDLHPIEPWVLLGLFSGNVSIWSYRSQVIEKTFEIAKLPVRTTKFIANKEWFVVGSDDGFIRVYNYNTTEKVVEFEAHSDFIRSVVVHPSLPYVLSASDDKFIKLWDWEHGWECTKSFKGHEHYVMKVTFNPRDANVFASASLDRTIKLWNLGDLAPHFSVEAHQTGLNSVEFLDTDNKLYFVTGSDDFTAKVWDYDTMTCLQTLEAHTHNVTSIQFVQSNDSFIVTGSEDVTISVWNAVTYKLDHVFTSELGRVWTIGFIKESSQIILGCDEGTLVAQVISTRDELGTITVPNRTETENTETEKSQIYEPNTVPKWDDGTGLPVPVISVWDQMEPNFNTEDHAFPCLL